MLPQACHGSVDRRHSVEPRDELRADDATCAFQRRAAHRGRTGTRDLEEGRPRAHLQARHPEHDRAGRVRRVSNQNATP